MLKKTLHVLSIVLAVQTCYAQFINQYGVNVGASYSTQHWSTDFLLNEEKPAFKIGILAFAQAEKDLNNKLAIRTEIGYIQKGFKNKREVIFSNNSIANAKNKNVVLHDMALNVGLKIRLFNYDYSPYILLGCRGDYLLAYNDIEVSKPGSGIQYNMYESFIEEYNKFNVGALIALGINLKGWVYFDVEYNPNFTKSYNSQQLQIKDNTWDAKVGIRLNELIDRNKILKAPSTSLSWKINE